MREATNRLIGRFVAMGLLRETTGGSRDRLFAYEPYLPLLREGTEPLPPSAARRQDDPTSR